jgi:hypothetical protein
MVHIQELCKFVGYSGTILQGIPRMLVSHMATKGCMYRKSYRTILLEEEFDFDCVRYSF